PNIIAHQRSPRLAFWVPVSFPKARFIDAPVAFLASDMKKIAFTRGESGGREWFCVRSVASVSEESALSRFARVRSGARVGGRGRRECLRATRPARNGQR